MLLIVEVVVVGGDMVEAMFVCVDTQYSMFCIGCWVYRWMVEE